MAGSAPTIIYGAGGVGNFTPERLEETLSVLQKHNIKEIDTAYIYAGSEAALGKHNAAARFTIHTKAPGFKPGNLAKENVLKSVDSSLKDLGIETVELYYLHGPDPATPIEETLLAIQEIFAAGKFRRFGISNFTPEEVQKIYDIQAAAKSVLPTVFQGNYNAVGRHGEAALIPLLRKLKISYYAYSPIAGGFLVKESAQIRAKNLEGRWDAENPLATMYYSLYAKESLIQALDEWGQIAKDAGISKAALSYRWVAYHSAVSKAAGDALIIGASSVSQLEESTTAIEAGPLDAATASRASGIWEKVKDEAPVDNWVSYGRDNPFTLSVKP